MRRIQGADESRGVFKNPSINGRESVETKVNLCPSYEKPMEHRTLVHHIFECANRGLPRADFLHEISNMLMKFSGCDAVELWLKEGEKQCCCEITRRPKKSYRFQMIPYTKNRAGKFIADFQVNSKLNSLCWDIFLGQIDTRLPFFTKNGSFWIADGESLADKKSKETPLGGLTIESQYPSFALIPLVIINERIGLLQLKSERMNHFTEEDIEAYESIAQGLAMALLNQHAQAALLERVKELTCLYNLAQMAERSSMSMDDIFQKVVSFIPPAWQYQNSAASRIVFDGHIYATEGFKDSPHKQTANIVVRGKQRGVIEVVYTEEKPELDEGPFLKEERALIDNVAKQLALIVEQREVEEDREKLQDQLRHADRLATVGQLAAGIAHELNEPLSNILGFAQLAKKCPGIPLKAEEDIEKIVDASLHAREIIRRLSIFTRQMPPSKVPLNLNQVVEKGLYFLEARLAKKGVELRRLLSPDLPEIIADPVQLHQVLTNLVVNSMQAMPEGGTLTVQTLARPCDVSLIVEDTGIGMTEEVMKQVFIPFFTTKDVGQGTGLGLAMVKRIVNSHGGSTDVDSRVGRGSRFEIRVPITPPQDFEESEGDGAFG